MKKPRVPLLRQYRYDDDAIILAKLFLSPHTEANTIFNQDQDKFTADYNKFYKRKITRFQLLNEMFEVNTCKLAGHCKNVCSGCIEKTPGTLYRRALRTAFLFSDRLAFEKKLTLDILDVYYKADKLGYQAVIQLNASSDVNFDAFVEHFNAKHVGAAIFFDYTIDAQVTRKVEYDKTVSIYSFAEFEDFMQNRSSTLNCCIITRHGYHDSILDHEYFTNIKLFDGDISPFRFLDEEGVIVLKADKRGKVDTTDFLVNNWEILK